MKLTSWERGKLSQHAAGQAATYLGHYHTSGLFRGEIETMNNWRRLSDKLDGDEYSGDLPYIGYARNGFNPEKD